MINQLILQPGKVLVQWEHLGGEVFKAVISMTEK